MSVAFSSSSTFWVSGESRVGPALLSKGTSHLRMAPAHRHLDSRLACCLCASACLPLPLSVSAHIYLICQLCVVGAPQNKGKEMRRTQRLGNRKALVQAQFPPENRSGKSPPYLPYLSMRRGLVSQVNPCNTLAVTSSQAGTLTWLLWKSHNPTFMKHMRRGLRQT